MAADPVSVMGVVAAYKRPAMLRGLLHSIAGTKTLSKLIVVDNGHDSETEAVCKEGPVEVVYHRPARNLGCGGGVARGLTLGLQEVGVTHFCLFDDDAETAPGAVDILVHGMKDASADVGVPFVLNAEGVITWFPHLRQSRAWEVIRRPGLTPPEYHKLCGLEPVPFTWAPWPVMALSARVVRDCGFPRDDFWLCAEDVEYSLRLTYRHKGVLVPSAICRHLPPASSYAGGVEGGHYLRFCLMLQNLSYIGTRLPHARRCLRHLPGNYRRFVRTFGLNRHTVPDASLAWWRGAVRGKPAGVAGGDSFKRRFLALAAGNSAA